MEEGDDATDAFWDPTPLFDAARRGDLEGVKAAVMAGINVNAVLEVGGRRAACVPTGLGALASRTAKPHACAATNVCLGRAG